jgi:nitrogen fixation NifU-like protein
MAYSEKVLDHYENPRNVGAFEKGDDSVGTGMVGAPACGDVMKLQIKVGADGVIEDAKFKTYGCGSAIASSSLVTEWVKGKTLDQALAIKNTQIAEELALPPVKIHCSILAEDAIKAAVLDYQNKHAAPKSPAQAEGPPRRAENQMAITLTEKAANTSTATSSAAARASACALACAPPAARAWPTSWNTSTKWPRTACSNRTASRCSSTRKACRTSTARNSTSRAKA